VVSELACQRALVLAVWTHVRRLCMCLFVVVQVALGRKCPVTHLYENEIDHESGNFNPSDCSGYTNNLGDS
jgi:hypothetical protein